MATQDAITSRPKRQKVNNQNVYTTMHLYLCINEKWGCFKIGFSSNLDRKLQKLNLNGFKLLEERKMACAKEVKKKILSFIKFTGAETGKDLFEYQFEGWNSCWRTDHFAVKGIDHLIDLGNRCDAYLYPG